MPSGESLYHKFPDYRVDLESGSERVRVEWNGQVVADSERTTIVRESKHDPVLYFPREDVRFEWLERTEHKTFCPFKGDASYWTLTVDGRSQKDSAWSYEDPFEQVTALKNYIAFYPDRVQTIRES